MNERISLKIKTLRFPTQLTFIRFYNAFSCQRYQVIWLYFRVLFQIWLQQFIHFDDPISFRALKIGSFVSGRNNAAALHLQSTHIVMSARQVARNFMAHKYFNVVNQAHENFRSSHNTHTHNIGRRHGILRSAGNVRASCSHLFVNYEISNKLWTCTKLLLSLQCQCV